MSTVLVVDDKEMLRDSVGATLQRAGLGVIPAADGKAALEIIALRRPDAVVTDLRMPGMTGIELVEKAREIDEDVPFVVMTAYGAVETAVQAIKAGAFDYITKPFEGDELIVAVKRAIEHARLVRENAVLRSSVSRDVYSSGPAGGASVGAASGGGLDRLIGDSPAMRRVKQQVIAVAESHGTVLICGESGSGKEVVARAVHELSPRASEPFLAVNCAALSESLLESELFGHERGAFTGAERLRKGRFELADRGTLLLDEISEVSPRVQAKLLRVLQERAFERVGSSLTIGVDVRVIATSNRDLPAAVGRGEFRQDLFFRLNVLPIHLPPLRDRLEDVPSLAASFLARIAQREGRTARRFSDDAIAVMQHYPWPGNVRELQNICERAAVLSKSEVIERHLVEPWLVSHAVMPPVHVNGYANGHAVLGMNGHGSAHASVMNGNGGGGGVPSRLAPVLASAGLAHVHGGITEPKPTGNGFSGLGGGLGGGVDGHVAVDGRALEDIERDAIVRTLTKFNGHRQRTAQALGIGVRTLGLKLKKWKEDQLVEQNL